MSGYGFFRLALILGLISAIGPFAIDMYLPALPSIGASLGASAGAVQMSLTVFFVTVGVSQLFYGPLTDSFGRKAPLYFGLVLFALGSVGCALAPNIGMLIAFRAVEAVGACAGMVVPRAIVRDLHTGSEATRLMSLLMLVFSISPILAPLTGSAIIAVASWRGIFWAVTLAAAIGLLLTATQLGETQQPEARRPSSFSGAWAGYRLLLGDRAFLRLTFIGAFSMSSFFIYLGSSSFILIGHYGFTPTEYSLFFAMNAMAFIGTAQLNGWLTGRFGLPAVIRVSSIGFAFIMVLLFGIMAAGVERLDVMAALLFVGFGFVGLIMPTTSVLALEEHGAIAGSASALMGALQMFTGSAVMAIVGLFADGLPMPMITGIAGCAATAFLLTLPGLEPAARGEASAE